MSDIANYEVGYRRPPKHTQFQKGECGNPRRKRKARSQTFASLIDGALERRIWISEGDRRKRVTILEAITTQLADAAAKGDGEAVDLLMLLDSRGKKHGRGQTVIVEIIPDDGKVIRCDRDDDGDH
ncbi:MAG: hypothetical protein KGJ49_01470 [Alphaproteobacteria bacterium]|nr:hypothetical protein [Alphaproteobacteria bacterium]